MVNCAMWKFASVYGSQFHTSLRYKTWGGRYMVIGGCECSDDEENEWGLKQRGIFGK